MTKRLVVVGIFSELIYLCFYLLKYYFGFLDLHIQSHLTAVIILLAILYLVYFWIMFKVDFNQSSVKTTFIFTVIFHLSFVFTSFFTSNDLHSYIAAGRVANYGANPYLATYSNYPNDTLYPIISNFWSTKTTLYGPLFLFISKAINILGNNHYLLTIVLFKSILIIVNLLNVYLVYKITHHAKSIYLFGWNPLIIYELAANAHNESLLIFFLLLAFLFIKNGSFAYSFFFLTLSVLLKYSSAIIAPFYAVSLLKANSTARKKCSDLVLIGASCLLVVGVVYYPFWQGKASFAYLLTYYRGQTISPSLGIWLLGKVTGYALAFKINNLLFVVLGVLLGFWFVIKKYTYHKLVLASLVVYVIFILTKLGLVLSWYLTPLVALSALNLKKHKNISLGATVAIAAYHVLLYWFVK